MRQAVAAVPEAAKSPVDSYLYGVEDAGTTAIIDIFGPVGGWGGGHVANAQQLESGGLQEKLCHPCPVKYWY